MKTALKVIVFFVIVAGLVYAYKSYQLYTSSDYEAEGFLVCNPDKTVCENSQHIHADIELIACGEAILFEKEKGRTDLLHTHKELNKLHWHAREKVDPVTLEPLDPTTRRLKSFLVQMEYQLPTTCNGNQTTTTLWVNGVEEPLLLDYIYTDGDQLKLEVK